MSFYAIIWSIWLLRNDMVFNGKVFDLEQIIDSLKFRLASWFKAKWPVSPHSILDIVRFPKDIMVTKEGKTNKRPIVWTTPHPDFLKFNVDDSARGKPGPAGIGGVLRDCNASVKAVFSKSIGVVDSNLAELLAVREALQLFVTSHWASSHKLIIESDSSNVVKWMSNPSDAPWRMKKYIGRMDICKQQLLSCDFILIPREGNDMADELAKAGVDRQHDLVAFFE